MSLEELIGDDPLLKPFEISSSEINKAISIEDNSVPNDAEMTEQISPAQMQDTNADLISSQPPATFLGPKTSENQQMFEHNLQ